MNRGRLLFPSWPARFAAFLFLAAVTAPGAQKEKTEQPFEIVNVELLDREGGYPLAFDSIFFPGERVFFRFNVAGFTRGEYDRINLSWRLESLGPDGKPFARPEEGEIDTELAPQDREWLPIIRHSPELPSHAPGGIYKVVLTVRDELANKEAKREVPVHVEGENVEAAQDLAVRDFSFTEGMGGRELPQGIFRPGESIWASFYITGYQLKDDNTFIVESRLKVLDEDGEPIIQFAPQAEKGSPFYPRRWIPAQFRIDLDDDIPSGEYSIILTVYDKVAGISFQTMKPFTVQ